MQRMGFIAAIKACLSRYFQFSGRASRPEYWYFFLFLALGSITLSVLDLLIFGNFWSTTAPQGTVAVAEGPQPLSSVFGLATLIPHLAVGWRRMHDTGRSGLYLFVPLALTLTLFALIFFGIGLADMFADGGNFDILFTRVTLAVSIPALIILLLSPLLVLWWLSRPGTPGTNKYGPNPTEVAS